ncbi:MAG: type II toxin-antitoxin system PemK/MazF family toxin [Cyanobacteria bacterium]|nr:type II toxin-antitoxin system PemK/MazF family toxin [Cyanobacteriota bacterium]
MKRGEIWTMAGGPGYASKPRPAVIIQDDGFSETLSIAVCPLNSEPVEAPILRLLVEATPENGLRHTSRLMVDKVTTVPKSRLGQRIGCLADEDLLRLNRSLLVFLGLAR